MASYDYGKQEVCEWIRKRFPADSKVLDVGAGDGKMYKLLPEYMNMDACDIWPPNAVNLEKFYKNVFVSDIADLAYKDYDLILFCDVIEHMDVAKAQAVLEYAKLHCKDMIIAVPFKYPQGELYGNKYETHLQPDLTPALFDERYPGFEPVWKQANYCYYHLAEVKNVNKNNKRQTKRRKAVPEHQA